MMTPQMMQPVMQSSMMMQQQQSMIQQPIIQPAQGQQIGIQEIQGQYTTPMENIMRPRYV